MFRFYTPENVRKPYFKEKWGKKEQYFTKKYWGKDTGLKIFPFKIFLVLCTSWLHETLDSNFGYNEFISYFNPVVDSLDKRLSLIKCLATGCLQC